MTEFRGDRALTFCATVPEGREHIVFLTTARARPGDPKEIVARFKSFKAAMDDCADRNLAALKTREGVAA